MNQHLSSEQMTNLLLGEASGTEHRHLSECEGCRAELNLLKDAFSLYREAGRNWSERSMTLAAPVRRSSNRVRRWVVAGVLTAAAVAAILISRPSKKSQQAAEDPFVAIPYVIPAASYERTQVIRMDVPVGGLRSAGLTVQVRDAAAVVQADVLVGQDGRALAVRLVERRRNR